MVKTPPLLTPAHVTPPAIALRNSQRGSLLSFLLTNQPSRWLGPVIFFLSFPAALWVRPVCWASLGPLPYWTSPPWTLKKAEGTYDCWNPQNSESTVVLGIGYDMMIFSFSCYILSCCGEEVRLGRILCYKCHNIESTGRPALLVCQTCIRQPKPTGILARSWAGPLLLWSLGLCFYTKY